MIKFANLLTTLKRTQLIVSSCLEQSVKSKCIIKSRIIHHQGTFFASKKQENKSKKHDYQKNRPKPLTDYLEGP